MATPDTGLGFLSDYWQAGSRELSNAGTNAMNFVEALGAPSSGRQQVALGTSAAKLGANVGALPSGVGQLAGDVTNLTNIITGLQQGGWSGYGGAAVNTAQLAGNLLQQGAKAGYLSTGEGALGQEISGIAAPLASALSVYNFAKNWQSGATGADALRGAQTGATIGTEVLPGVGTLIGAGIGVAVGAASSIFGPGREDPENIGWDQYAAAYQKGGAQSVAGATPSQNFQMLAGIFDARGSSIPFYNQYGRMGESAFFGAMTSQINSALASGALPSNATPQQIYSQVVQPWINGMSTGGWQNSSTIQGAPEKDAIGNLLTNLIGQWQSGQMNSQTPLGIAGQTVAMQNFGAQGMPPQQQQVAQQFQTAYQPMQSAFTSLGLILGGTSTW